MQLVNIANKDRDIFLFLRNNKGTLDIQKVSNFFPYFYERDISGKYTSYKGDKLRKVVCSTPKDQRKAASQQAFESDIPFVKKYLIDKVDNIEKTCIKYAFLDIEVLCNELPDVSKAKFPVSCISIYNSLHNNIQTFWLANFQSEYDMLEAFIAYMQEEKFDLWLSWNVGFDYNYLYNRIPDFAKRISPIQEERYINQDIKYPAGISIVDYLELFRKITLNKEFSYALDYISQKYLKDNEWGHTDFNTLNPIVKEKNINDVRRMTKLENLKRIIPYYDEIRRLTKVEWEDLTMNSRMIDMLLLDEAKRKGIVLPNKPEGKEEFEYEGAYREAHKTGLLKGICKVDLAGAYPAAIINFNLDPANLRQEPEENSVKIGDYYFIQNSNALLPTIVKKLVDLKAKTKEALEKTREKTIEHEQAEMKYNACKSLVNSAYGTFGMKFFRLYEHPVASSTTYLIRDLLHTVEDQLNKEGTNVVYTDTDAIFATTTKNITPYLNEMIKKWGREKYKVEVDITFDFEGYFSEIFIISKCLEGNTRILTDKGAIAIKTLYNNTDKYKIISINSNNEKEILPIKKIWKTPTLNRKIYTLQLKYNRQKNCKGRFTEDHPMLTERGYVEIKDLKITDKIHTGTLEPGQEVKEAMIGTLLGDGFISQGIFHISHGLKQKEYAEAKANLLFDKEICQSISRRVGKYFSINYTSHSMPFFKHLEDIFYRPGKDIRSVFYKRRKTINSEILKDFSIISLAYLFMDDGYTSKRQCVSEIAICSFTLKEVTLLSNKIKELGIDNKIIQTGGIYYRLYFNSKNAKTLSEKIAPYVLKCMSYKLRPEHRSISKKNIINNKGKVFYSPFILNIYNKKVREVYDLEVEKNHNFLTTVGVAHNCHYIGNLIKKNGEKKKEMKGIEVKRKDSSVFIKDFQEKMLDKILADETEENLQEWILTEKERFKTLPPEQIAFPAKLSKEYGKNIPIFKRALDNTPILKKNLGDLFYYIYVKGAKRGENNMVLAFDKNCKDHIVDIDWDMMIERNIYNKAMTVFEAMGWNVGELKNKIKGNNILF